SFFQNGRNEKCATNRAKINKARLERIPLHSCATSMDILGRRKMNPSRSTGAPLRLKKTSAIAAEPDCSQKTILRSNSSGMRMANSKKVKAKNEARALYAPRVNMKPAINKRTSEKA